MPEIESKSLNSQPDIVTTRLSAHYYNSIVVDRMGKAAKDHNDDMDVEQPEDNALVVTKRKFIKKKEGKPVEQIHK